MNIPKGWYALHNGDIVEVDDAWWCSVCEMWHYVDKECGAPTADIYIVIRREKY